MPFKTPNRIVNKLTDERDVFDGDYRRSWGDNDAVKKIHEFLRSDPTKADPKFIKEQFPQADDDLINDALAQVETVETFAGIPLSSPEYYYRGIRYAPSKEEEQKLKEETFRKVNSKLPF